MAKYAMIPINRKYEDDGWHVRKVLISYKGKPFKRHYLKFFMYFFRFTKIIAVDDYFTDSNSSHQYVFKNRYYRLLKCSNGNKNNYKNFSKIMMKKRRYHIFIDLESNLFEAKSNEEAIKIFKSREELR